MKRTVLSWVAVVLLMLVPALASASMIIGGDAASQAAANDILDIMFLIDTSGSMSDDIINIGNAAAGAIQNLQCPGCDVWVRAHFMGIGGTSGAVWNENFNNQTYSTLANSSEDNGVTAYEAIIAGSGTWWANDAAVGQDYYRAVVTIGDEGTQDGQPVDQADWDAAYLANQAAIANNVFLFSWVTNDPYTGVPDLFQKMAVGGAGGGYAFGPTGGSFVNDQAGTGDVAATLEQIICTAGGGGTQVPEPAAVLLLGLGLFGLAGARRFRK